LILNHYCIAKNSTSCCLWA